MFNLNRLFNLKPKGKSVDGRFDVPFEVPPQMQTLGALGDVPISNGLEQVRMPARTLNTARLFGGLGNSQERNQFSGYDLPTSERTSLDAPTLSQINTSRLFSGFNKPDVPPAPPMNITPDNLEPQAAMMPRGEGTGIALPPSPEDAQTVFAPNSIQSLPAPPPAPTLNTARLFSNFNDPSLADTAPQSQQIQNRINSIQSKDYTKAVYDDKGNLVKAAGADRDKNWTLGDKILSTLVGVGEGLMQGGLLGAAAGGISAGTNRNFMEQRGDARQVNKLFGSWNQARENEDFQTQQQLRNAQIGEVKRKPEKERQAQEDKLELETNRQVGRIEAMIAKDRLAGKNYKIETLPDGRIIKKYPDREEPFLDEKTGQQEYDLIKKPEAMQVADGTNPDGTPKYRTVYVPGGQYANLKGTENYRAAMIRLGEGRLAETVRGNKASESNRVATINLAKERLAESVKKYNDQKGKSPDGTGDSEKTKLARNREKIKLVNARHAIQSDIKLSQAEKTELLKLLPTDLDEDN